MQNVKLLQMTNHIKKKLICFLLMESFYIVSGSILTCTIFRIYWPWPSGGEQTAGLLPLLSAKPFLFKHFYF